MRRIAFLLILVVIVVGIVAFVMARRDAEQAGNNGPIAGSTSVASGEIAKPKPVAVPFMGCPPSGSGGDPLLNTLKNRIDEAPWHTTTISDLLALTWPEAIEQRPRSRWSAQDKAAVARYEGSPVQVEGYILSAKKMSPETCNCHSVDYVDYHLWMADSPNKVREQSIVIEVSPRVQSYHPEWTLRRLQEIARNRERVRISGWLLMDPEHPDQIGKTRGSIWEIHPIMQIETREFGGWTPLDGGSTGVTSVQTAAEAIPTLTVLPTVTEPPVSSEEVQVNRSVQITDIFFNGVIGSQEPDEYVEITNSGPEPVDITDWELQDTTGDREYKWENYIMQPGEKIRIYTNEVHEETGGFSFRSRGSIWRNSGDVAELYDLDKQLVSRYAYGNQR